MSVMNDGVQLPTHIKQPNTKADSRSVTQSSARFASLYRIINSQMSAAPQVP